MSKEFVGLSHGAGGESMRRFIGDLFIEAFDNPELNALGDAAMVSVDSERLAFTTDSYTIKPILFPGGNIGELSVCGTVNDLAVMGARPAFLSFGCIIEEGFDLDTLKTIIHSAAETAKRSGVKIVTGDTKVVPRGECDEIFINTAGIGLYPMGLGLSKLPISAGDAVIVSGTIGDHGTAIISARNQLQFETDVQSDCAPLNGLIESLLNVSSDVKWMRDATRGGLAAVLIELVESRPFGVLLDETRIPVRDDVQAVCELLGFDPMHLANEGKVVIVVGKGSESDAVRILKQHPLGLNAEVIGHITDSSAGQVRIKTQIGGIRRLHRPAGELLPRIC
jgi:hydrogenase expression/formation protein HypE